MLYYLFYQNNQYGPYTEEQVQSMFQKQIISPNVLVFQQGGVQNWQPLSKFPNLMKHKKNKDSKWITNPYDMSMPINTPEEVEKTVWEARPSNITVLTSYITYLVLLIAYTVLYTLFRELTSPTNTIIIYIYTFLVVFTIFKAIWLWINVKSIKWTLTSQRFVYSFGVFSKRIENIELYRIKDIRVRNPFFYRIFNYGFIDLTTSDKANPIIKDIGAIKKPTSVYQLIRKYVERQKRSGHIKGLEIV